MTRGPTLASDNAAIRSFIPGRDFQPPRLLSLALSAGKSDAISRAELGVELDSNSTSFIESRRPLLKNFGPFLRTVLDQFVKAFINN